MKNQIEKIEVGKLREHPENPNKMGRGQFKKLCAHIKESGNYEPVIVRVHPQEKRCYQIINGHHRVQALNELGYETVNCVVWDVDDDQARILLATLNRIGVSDVMSRKIELIKKLREKFDAKTLASRLPDNKKIIEKLAKMNEQTQAKILECKEKEILKPRVFFLNAEQNRKVEMALAHLMDKTESETITAGKAKALVKMAEMVIEQEKARK